MLSLQNLVHALLGFVGGLDLETDHVVSLLVIGRQANEYVYAAVARALDVVGDGSIAAESAEATLQPLLKSGA